MNCCYRKIVVEQLENRYLLAVLPPVEPIAPPGSLIYQSIESAAIGSDVLDSERFESGALDARWATSSSTPEGRIQMTGAFGTASGSFALWMDRTPSGSNNLNEAIWTVDLSGVSDAEISFFHAEYGDEDSLLPLDFTGSVVGDGVSISDDGVNWRTILNSPNQSSGVWQQYTFDLEAEAAAAGMTLGPNFQIKFQQYDNYPLTSDGRGWDEIVITTPVAGDTDTFTIDVDPGQTITLAVETDANLQAGVKLLAGADGNNVVASGTASAPGEEVVLETVATAGQIANNGPNARTYRVVVEGLNDTVGNYTVRAVLNAELEHESHGGSSNDTLDTAQDLEPSFVQLHRATGANNSGAQPARAAVLGTAESAAAADPVAEVEPNNTLATAQNLDGEEFTVAVDPNIAQSTAIPHLTVQGTGDGTFDYYSFSVANAGDIGIFDIDYNNFDTELFLYDTSGNLLAANDDNYSDPGSGGYASLISYTFAAAGTYVIGVGEYNSYNDGGKIGGNTPDTGDTYTLHVSVAGQPFTPPTPDVYSFNLAAGESVTVAATALSTGSVDLELQDLSGTVVATASTVGTNVDKVISSFSSSEAGTYFAVVHGDGSDYSLVVARNADFDIEQNGDLGSAQEILSTEVAGRQWVLGSLDLGEVPGIVAEVEPNNTPATAQNLDGAGFSIASDPNIAQSTAIPHLTVQATGDGTFDYYSFSVANAGDIGIFDIDYNNFDTELFLYDTSGNLLAANDDNSSDPGSGGYASLISYTFAAPGTYVIGVGRYYSYDAGGQIGGSAPNPGASYALHVSIQNGPLGSPSDWYEVSLTEHELLQVQTSTPGAGSGQFANGLDPMVRVYDAVGNLVASDDNSASDGRNARLTFHVPAGGGGTYYVDVTPSDATSQMTTGEYILSIKASYAAAVDQLLAQADEDDEDDEDPLQEPLVDALVLTLLD